MKKILSVILALIMLIGTGTLALSAASATTETAVVSYEEFMGEQIADNGDTLRQSVKSAAPQSVTAQRVNSPAGIFSGIKTVWTAIINFFKNLFHKPVTPPVAASTLKINLTSPSADPTTISEGSSLGIHGDVSSNYNITKVEGSVLNSSGSKVQNASCTPNATTLKLDTSTINNNIIFNNLKAGEYKLKITATDKSGKTVEVTKRIIVDSDSIPDITKGWYWPLSKNYTSISSGFGYRPSMGDYHQGIDISSSNIAGQPIYAARKGTVVYVGIYYNCGNMVTIKHGTYNGATIYTTYMHMKDKSCVSVGQTVDQNTVLGYVGATGTNGKIEYGPHLHFQICKNDKNPKHSNNDQLNANYYNPSPSNISYSYIH